jgi:hypothetical protein
MPSLAFIIKQMIPETAQIKSLRAAWQRHRFRPSEKDRPVSLRYLINRRKVESGTTYHVMLSYNTYMLRGEIPLYDYLFPKPDLGFFGDIPIIGEGLEALAGVPAKVGREIVKSVTGSDGKIEIESMPAIEARGSEIGQAIANGEGGNIVVLCEVWKEEFLSRILKPIRDAGISVQVVQGPQKTGDGGGLGSGLYVLGLDSSIQKIASHVFKNKGTTLNDADAWAQKAVIYSRVNVGVGFIDLYSTHLHSGGDMPNLGPLNSTPTDEAKHAVRIQQCEELVDFINKTHDRKNVAILTGDFNINAHDTNKYNELSSVMSKANLFDLWALQYGNTAMGMTNAPNGDFNKVCPMPKAVACDEMKALPADHGGSRIDYIFIEAPSNQHTFNLDVTVMQRRPFKRAVPTEGEQFMSDHLGLSIGLFCSPLV